MCRRWCRNVWTIIAARRSRSASPCLLRRRALKPQAAAVCRVRADREGLREILDNLLDNAIKYTPEGGSVSVHWRSNGAVAQIAVRDSGIGITPEDQERIFERFYRVDKARSRELGGTGLGLSIVKHLAQSMNGAVAVESEVGKGSTFTVELPVG